MINFLNSGFFTALTTILTAFVAIFLYYWEQRKKKRDAAKIIIQEIRRAEDLISEYKEHGGYKFTKKIIATNSWAKNIHYFVGNLAQDEVDKISTLYSTGEYLDTIIAKVSDHTFDEQVKSYESEVKQIVAGLQNPITSQQSTSGGDQSGAQVIPKIIQRAIPVKIQIPPPWKILLDEISYNYEPIYHSSICEKLKKIGRI